VARDDWTDPEMWMKNDRFDADLAQIAKAFQPRFVSRNGGLFVFLKHQRESNLIEPGPSGGAENTFNHFHVCLRFSGTPLDQFWKNRRIAEALASVWYELAWRAHPEHDPFVCVTNETEEFEDGSLGVHSIVRLWSGNGPDADALCDCYHVRESKPDDVIIVEDQRVILLRPVNQILTA
jgi:hypothetical protein